MPHIVGVANKVRLRKAIPYCECGYRKEMVDHSLLKHKELGHKPNKEGENVSKVRLSGDLKLIKYTLKNVEETGRMNM